MNGPTHTRPAWSVVTPSVLNIGGAPTLAVHSTVALSLLLPALTHAGSYVMTQAHDEAPRVAMLRHCGAAGCAGASETTRIDEASKGLKRIVGLALDWGGWGSVLRNTADSYSFSANHVTAQAKAAFGDGRSPEQVTVAGMSGDLGSLVGPGGILGVLLFRAMRDLVADGG